MTVSPLPEGYYLLNFQTVLQEVEARYGDLLEEGERVTLACFRSRSLAARRLYVRMLTRRGPWFRRDRLHYPEIGDPAEPAAELVAAGLCEATASCGELLSLLTRPELHGVLAGLGAPAPRSLRREELAARLAEAMPEPRLQALLQEQLGPVRCRFQDLWRRVFFLFFGNFEQDLSSFVVADLGNTRFETYPIDPATRLFGSRREVDFLLQLRDLRDQLEAGLDEAELRTLTQIALGLEPHPGVRQQHRFQGLLNDLGHAWERAGQGGMALACYARSQRPPARERSLRLLAAQGDLTAACAGAMELFASAQEVGEVRFARRFLERHRRKVAGVEAWLEAHPSPKTLPERRLVLPRHPSGSVELAALEAARSEGWEGFFAENALWRGLFGLVLWEQIFAPVPGAFQHRFQHGPLDLRGTDFYDHRKALIDPRLDQVAACRNLPELVLEVFDRKQGLANAFVSWRHLDRAQLAEALARIEPPVLASVLRHMATNPLAFDCGFPDLFLHRSHQWRLWEVKGPGDSLRPEQAWWLQQFLRLGCEAAVVRVAYAG